MAKEKFDRSKPHLNVGTMGHIVSIGFNQPFDSPEALKAFSTQHGIHLPNWEFLSPAPAIVDELTQNFGFSYVATTAGFDHLNQISFVDADDVYAGG